MRKTRVYCNYSLVQKAKTGTCVYQRQLLVSYCSSLRLFPTLFRTYFFFLFKAVQISRASPAWQNYVQRVSELVLGGLKKSVIVSLKAMVKHISSVSQVKSLSVQRWTIHLSHVYTPQTDPGRTRVNSSQGSTQG